MTTTICTALAAATAIILLALYLAEKWKDITGRKK